MRSFYIAVGLFLSLCLSAAEYVHHPAPKEPLYLNTKLYADFKKGIPGPPLPKSAKQSEDEAEILRFQKSRTTTDCDSANSEVKVTLTSFFAEPDGPLSTASTNKLQPFFEQVRNDADYFIQLLKKDFPRQRPFLYLAKVEPCVPKEVTGAYPSGHAVLSQLFAMILSDLYPQHQAALQARASVIAQHRVISGMHHPTDIQDGSKLGALVYQELQKSPKFKVDLEKVKKGLI